MRSWAGGGNHRHQMDTDTSYARQLEQEETIRRQARAKSRRLRDFPEYEMPIESRFDEIRRELEDGQR